MPTTTKQLNSSAISKLEYDDSSKSLTITFSGGGTDTRSDVSKQQFDDFAAASSAGKYYHANFRSR